MKKELTLKEGVVLSGGEEIGRYDAATNTLHCPERISPRLYAGIASLLGQKPNYDFAPPNKPDGAPIHESAEVNAVTPTGIVTPAASAPATSISEIPQFYPTRDPANIEPPQDPRFGDKTPEWARWLRDTNPEAFAKRFAGRVLNLD